MEEISRILRPYFRGLPIIIGAMIICFLIAKKYLSYTTPMYESTTKIKLADLTEGATGNNLFKDLDVFATSNQIAMEIEVLKSQILVSKTIQKLDFNQELHRIGKVKSQELYDEKPFFHNVIIHDAKLYNKEWKIRILDSVNYQINLEKEDTIYEGQFGIPLDIKSSASILLTINKDLQSEKSNLHFKGLYKLIHYSDEKLIGSIISNLDIVSIDKDVAVLRIIFKSTVPKKAMKFTDALAEAYVEDYIEQKFKTANVTSDFLDQQISKVYNDLSKTEMKIQGYKVDNNIINIRQETETDLRKISQLKIQKTNVKMSLDAVDQLNQYLIDGKNNFLELAPNFEAFTDLLSTEMIKKIKVLQAEKTDLLVIYKQDHETVLNVDKKIKYYTDYFIESVNNTKLNLETKYNKLVKDIEDAERVFIGLPQRERILTILNRDFQIQQQSYIFLNEKKIEADIAKAAKHAFHRILRKSNLPQKPVSPNRPIIIIVSVVLGMIGAILFIFLVNAYKARVNDISSIEKNTDIPLIYSIPHFKNEKPALDFFKNEVLKLDMKGLLQKNHSITFTSFKNNQGAKYHLEHIGQIFSEEKRNFLIVTFDQKHTFKIHNDNLLVKDESEILNLTFSELSAWHNSLCQKYDFVLFDNYSINEDPKSILFMGLSNLNICVMDTRKTLLSSISELNVLQAKNNINELHISLNNQNYSPSLITEGLWIIKFLIESISKK